MNQIAPDTYSRTQKMLHWGVVVLLAIQYLFFDHMGRLFHQTMEGGSPVWTTTSVAHSMIGAAVLALTAWRLILRRSRGTPPPPADEPDLATRAARVTHVALYVLLIGLPVVGLGAWFLGIGFLAEVHEIGSTVLLWVVGLHVGAVLVHQFWWNTAILRRMT
ncbi:cytochrome b [Puniceibacterium sediminis]|uniref:Cytochrome b561 n=1 Tax=Puniceibacterium sediminis TaxID=1608407 RepID=A0A238ZGV5_9RHOB|nr:cytochrome b/b6 domain-containing protein [Puniceibacterium sediminis]SNR82382.1 cytochrome b561 [Puniceibacterium sediminis]